MKIITPELITKELATADEIPRVYFEQAVDLIDRTTGYAEGDERSRLITNQASMILLRGLAVGTTDYTRTDDMDDELRGYNALSSWFNVSAKQGRGVVSDVTIDVQTDPNDRSGGTLRLSMASYVGDLTASESKSFGELGAYMDIHGEVGSFSKLGGEEEVGTGAANITHVRTMALWLMDSEVIAPREAF